MVGRDRVNRMFLRQDQDRIPRCESFWDETLVRWEREGQPKGGAEAVYQMLGSDFQGLCWNWPAPFPGRREVVAEDHETQTVTDAWAQPPNSGRAVPAPRNTGPSSATAAKSGSGDFKPALLATGVQINLEELKTSYAHGRKLGRWCHLTGVESFEAIRKLIGDVVGLEAMAFDPDWIADISRTHTDVVLRNFDAALATGVQPDGVWMYGDMAYNHATMCSPAMYRELVWPDHKRLADWRTPMA